MTSDGAEPKTEQARRDPRLPGAAAGDASSERLDQADRWFKAGKITDAIAVYEELLRTQPRNCAALNNLGVAWRRAGDAAKGAKFLRMALSADPRNPDAHYNLGNALADANRADEAIACYRRALQLRPTYAAAYVNLARLLKRAGKTAAAHACLIRGLAAAADDAALHSQLGLLLWDQGKDQAALQHYRIAARFDPADAQIHHNIAAALLRIDRYEEAAASAARAIALNERNAETHAILAQSRIALGNFEAAQAPLDRALALDPNNLSALLARARALLLQGKLAEGWAAYEARWKRSTAAFPKLAGPLWDGRDPGGKRIALVTEQGFGDSIQFIRYAAALRERGARVQVICEPPLVRLFSRMRDVDRVAEKGGPLPAFDAYVPLLEVARHLGTTLETIPGGIPYLAAQPAGRRQPLPTVALVWAGSERHENDRNRSLPLERFLPLLARPGIRFVSLQVGPRREDIRRLGAEGLLSDWGGQVKDFADTADLMARVDLVISVDTAAAHLAGALGKPVWTLIPYAPDWRWMLERVDSPWYPAMRLLRQAKPGDWEAVIHRLDGELDRFVAELISRRKSDIASGAAATRN